MASNYKQPDAKSSFTLTYKSSGKKVEDDDDEDDCTGEEEEEDGGGRLYFYQETIREKKKKKKTVLTTTSGGVAQPCCQVENCGVDLTNESYYRRHKVCEVHAKAPVVIVAGVQQRFCQQCSRFHELTEFDKAKRSCRRRLAGHNERRRRKSSSSETTHGEASAIRGLSRLKETRHQQAAGARGSSSSSICGKSSPSNKHIRIR